MKTSLPHKQKGAIAIEFALVLIIFFGAVTTTHTSGLLTVATHYLINKINAAIPFLNLPAPLTTSVSLQL
jgi:hypothetical protein